MERNRTRAVKLISCYCQRDGVPIFVRELGNLEHQTYLGNRYYWGLNEGRFPDYREHSRRIIDRCPKCSRKFQLLLPSIYVHDELWENLGILIVTNPESITVELGKIKIEQAKPAPPLANVNADELYRYRESQSERRIGKELRALRKLTEE